MKHLCGIFLLLVAAMLLAQFTSCGGSEADEELLRQLEREGNLAMSQGNMAQLDSIAPLLLAEARRQGNSMYEGSAHFLMTYFTPGVDSATFREKMRHVEAAESIAKRNNDRWLLCRIYNQHGVWELNYLGNVSTAQYWFLRSIEHTPDRDNRAHTLPAEINLSETYRINGDSIGFSHDLSLFEYSSKHIPETLVKFATAYHCATYEASRVSDTLKLKPYIDQMRLMQDSAYEAVEIVYARHFFARGDYDEAEKHIRHTNPKLNPESALLYAQILSKLKRYADSEAVLDSASIMSEYRNFRFFGEYLRLRASNAESRGDLPLALERQKHYELFRDSLEAARTLDLSKRYRTEYEVSVKDNEILRQKSEIHNYIIIILLIVAFVLISAAFLWLWLRKRNRLYQDIVSQNREHILREQILTRDLSEREKRIADLEKSVENTSEPISEPISELSGEQPDAEEKPQQDSGSASRLSEEKADCIFREIRRQTDEEQIWRDVNITRDRFAELVGCNRTYFTEVIKAKTGMNYSQYMNSCRVQEAVRVLSFPASDMLMADLSKQLGFLSVQTFYSAFRSMVGMSPAAYRKTALKMKDREVS